MPSSIEKLGGASIDAIFATIEPLVELPRHRPCRTSGRRQPAHPAARLLAIQREPTNTGPTRTSPFERADEFDLATPSATATIANNVIQRSATGSVADGDHFGFLAGQIGLLEIRGVKVTLTPGASNEPVGSSGDLRVREDA